jgi:hypothetical protein
MPIVMNSCWKVPKNPESSKGAVYLIKRGTIALKIPAHIPWQNRRIIYVLRSVKKISMPMVKAA